MNSDPENFVFPEPTRVKVREFASYSPGPWRTDGEDIHDNTGLKIGAAHMRMAFGNDKEAKAKQRTNAQLIAAAPMLYEALVEMVAYFGTELAIEDLPSLRNQVQEALRAARVTVADAESATQEDIE